MPRASGLDFGTRVLVAGYSTRAMADSAARAGFEVTSVDAFADLDQHPLVNALTPEPHSTCADSEAVEPGSTFAESVVAAAEPVVCSAVAFGSPFENHPEAVHALGQHRQLWGNTPDVLRVVRDPVRVAEAFARRGLAVPAVRVGGSAGHPTDVDASWLLKPLASGGGKQVTPWNPASTIPAEHYVQELIEGEAWSVAFVAANGHAIVLAICRQLIGLATFGATGFRYCGSILDGSCRPPEWLADGAAALADAAAELGLIGLNGIDFVVRGKTLYPIEVNPRWSASMELVERGRGLSMFAVHAEACLTTGAPTLDATISEPFGHTIGKAVIFAQHDAIAGDTGPWCATGSIRDVPRPGTRIQTGDPVCTVFAAAATIAECRAGLEARSADIFAALRAWSHRPS